MSSPVTTIHPINSLAAQLKQIGLQALPANLNDFLARATRAHWSPLMLLEQLAQGEAEDRCRRSMERRFHVSGIKSFKPMAELRMELANQDRARHRRTRPDPGLAQ